MTATLPAVTVQDSGAGQPSEKSPNFGVRSAGAATGLELSLRETPQSISVVTRAQIEAFGLTEIRDLLSKTTGVNVEQVETDRTYFTVRGFDVTNFMEDGIGMPFASGLLNGDLDTAIYDRVEVLRGANGLMSSTGNPSATVNFVRKRPTSQLRASGGLTLGSWGRKRVDADVSGALNASGSVRGRVVLASEDKDSYLDRYSASKQVFSGVLEVDLASSTTLTLAHALQQNRPKGLMWGALPLYDSNGAPIDYPTSASSAPSWTQWNTDDSRSFAELQHDMGGGWVAKASLIGRKIASDTRMLYIYGTPDATTGEGLFSWPSTYDHQERQRIVDLRLQGPFELGGRRHEALIGLSSGRNKVDMASSYDDLGLPLTLSDVLSGVFTQPDFDQGVSAFGNRVDKRHTVFSAGKFNLRDGVKLIAGLNLTRATSNGVQYGEQHNYAATKAQPFAGLVVDMSDTLSAYGSVASIFNPQTQLDINGAVLNPIQGRTQETGLKFESRDKKLNASVALFRTQQANTADYAGFANGRSYYAGIDARSKGIEFDVAGTPLPGWQVSAGFTHLQIKGSDGQDVRTYVPRQTVRLSTLVAVPSVPGLELGGAIKWQGEVSRNQGGGVTTRQKAYALLDVLARYAFDRQLTLAAQIHNLTNEKHINSLYWDQNYYGAPRAFSVNLNWKY